MTHPGTFCAIIFHMQLLINPTRAGLAVLLSILVALSLPVLAVDGGEATTLATDTGKPSESILVTRVEAAMLWLVSSGIPSHNIAPNKRNPVYTDPGWRHELAVAIVAASRRWAVSPWFLVAVAFREGSFKQDARGDLEEQSTFQIMTSHGCDLKQVAGAADCAARLLRRYADRCGSVRAGFLRYATGRRICSPDTPHLKWMDQDRAGIARRLEQRFGALSADPQ